MEKRNKIIIIAISFALVLLFSGLTYAYFTSATSSESASTIVAKGGSMNIRYDNKSANITVSNIYPREEAWVNKKFQVIGNNTTDLDMIYKVKMIVDNNRFLRDAEGGRRAADAVHVRPADALHAHGLQILALAFVEEQVDGERRLPGARKPRERDELAARQGQVDVFQVALARTANDDVLHTASLSMIIGGICTIQRGARFLLPRNRFIYLDR